MRLRTLPAIAAALGLIVGLGAASAPAGAIDPLPFGVNTFVIGASQTTQQIADAVNDLNPGTVVRLGINWAELQRGKRGLNPTQNCLETDSPLVCTIPGPIYWAPVDAAVKVFGAEDVPVLLMIIDAPAWARALGDFPPSQSSPTAVPPGTSTTNMAQWQSFVTQAVQRVQGAVLSPDPNAHPAYPDILAGVQIWNEPNGQLNWNTTVGPDPVRYKNVLCRGEAGVEAADPDVPVITAGLHPTPEPQADFYYEDFLNQAYTEGMASCLDALGVHAYANDIQGVTDLLQTTRDILDSWDPGRTMSITELGDPTPTDAAGLAAFLVGAYDAVEDESDVNLFMVHSLFLMNVGEPICEAPGDPTLAAHALKAMLRNTTDPATC
jgi:hypothetical protein